MTAAPSVTQAARWPSQWEAIPTRDRPARTRASRTTWPIKSGCGTRAKSAWSADHNVALFPYNGQGLNYNLPMGATTPGGTVQTRLSTGLRCLRQPLVRDASQPLDRVQDVEPVDWHLRSAPARRLARDWPRRRSACHRHHGRSPYVPTDSGRLRLPKLRLVRYSASGIGHRYVGQLHDQRHRVGNNSRHRGGGPQPPRRLMLSPWLPRGLGCDPAWKSDPLRRGIGVQN